jgi:Disulphide bond corrector protein DsbC
MRAKDQRRELALVGAGAVVAIAFGVACAPLALAQSPLADSSNRPVGHGAVVEYLFPEQVTLPTGNPSPVTLHFRVVPGYHINSHKPKDESQIPTSFSVPESSGVRLESAAYPDGADYVLPLDPGTKLSVYAGEFTVQARLIAERGNHLVQASLHYQACDKSACYPPKTITVPIDVIGN